MVKTPKFNATITRLNSPYLKILVDFWNKKDRDSTWNELFVGRKKPKRNIAKSNSNVILTNEELRSEI